MARKNVTRQVDFYLNDDECLPLLKCVCGETFEPWDQIIGIYEDDPTECPICGAKLFFAVKIHVYQVVDKTASLDKR
jgi:DNA-directed RNA polymerase subunit RPC12/RpoP